MWSTSGSAKAGSTHEVSADAGAYCEPQKRTTMAVEVGLHHASPPLSNSGYSPWCVSCENGGTFEVVHLAIIVDALGNVLCWFVRFEATAL